MPRLALLVIVNVSLRATYKGLKYLILVFFFFNKYKKEINEQTWASLRNAISSKMPVSRFLFFWKNQKFLQQIIKVHAKLFVYRLVGEEKFLSSLLIFSLYYSWLIQQTTNW